MELAPPEPPLTDGIILLRLPTEAVAITHRGKRAAVLRGATAERFLEDVERIGKREPIRATAWIVDARVRLPPTRHPAARILR